MSCCNPCLKDVISCLEDGDELILNIGGLLDGETYIAVFTDSQGKEYAVPFQYNATEKTGTIPVGTDEDELPPTLCNPYIGEITIEIKDTDMNCVQFNLYVKTKCVTLEVSSAIGGAYAKKEIGIEIPVP